MRAYLLILLLEYSSTNPNISFQGILLLLQRILWEVNKSQSGYSLRVWSQLTVSNIHFQFFFQNHSSNPSHGWFQLVLNPPPLPIVIHIILWIFAYVYVPLPPFLTLEFPALCTSHRGYRYFLNHILYSCNVHCTNKLMIWLLCGHNFLALL